VEGEREQEASAPSQTARDTTPIVVTIRRWNTAAKKWREFVSAEPERGPPTRLRVTIPRQPMLDDEDNAVVVYTDPPSKRTLSRAIAASSNTRVGDYLDAAANLARTSKQLDGLLRRFKLKLMPASTLATALRKRPLQPTVKEYASTRYVQRQLEEIDRRIWLGELPEKEDKIERIAFWNEQLLEVRTPGAHRDLSQTVDEIVSKPRVPETEQGLLDVFARNRRHEEVLAHFAPVRQQTGKDTISLCHRWSDLIEIGERCFLRRDPGAATASIRDAVLSQGFGRDLPDAAEPLAVEWARRLQEDTQNLQHHAESAGFSSGETLPISNLALTLNKMLAGELVEFWSCVTQAQPLVNHVTGKASRSWRHVADRLYRMTVEIHHGVRRLLGLITAHRSRNLALLILDQYFRDGPTTMHLCGLGRQNDIEWRWITMMLAAHRAEADELWQQESGTPPRSLQRILARSGTPVEFAMLNENSHHGLVLKVARIFLDGANDPLRLPHGPMREGERDAYDLRHELVDKMLKLDSRWPPGTMRELEREHAAALAQPPDAKEPGGNGPKKRVLDGEHIRILKALRKATDGELKTNELKARTKQKDTTFKRRINDMKGHEVTSPRRGTWKITEAGRAALPD